MRRAWTCDPSSTADADTARSTTSASSAPRTPATCASQLGDGRANLGRRAPRGCGSRRRWRERSTSCSSTRPARSPSPTRSPSRAPLTTSCCSAIRSSSTSRCRGRIRRAPTDRRSRTSLATRRRCRRPWPLPRDAPGGCIPELARFTSEVFYDDRLESESHLVDPARLDDASRSVDGVGPRLVDVPSVGADNESAVEAEAVAELAHRLLDSGASWVDPDGAKRVARLEGRPHRRAVQRPGRRHRSGSCRAEARVGTVDKFQGQEAPISLYSMTTSSPELAPRGHGLPVQPQPAQRGDVAGPMRRGRRRVARPAARPGSNAGADAARECVLPLRGAGASSPPDEPPRAGPPDRSS